MSVGTTFMLSGGIEAAVETVRRAIDWGVNLFDTAPSYSDGRDEEVLGRSLERSRQDVLISTKVGYLRNRLAHRDIRALERQLEASLRRLRTDYVDILYVHEADFAWWWRPSRGETDFEWPFPLLEEDTVIGVNAAPIIDFLEKARADGKYRFLGVSGKSARVLARVIPWLPIKVVMVAHQLNAIYRNAQFFLLDLCRGRGLGVVVGAPLMRGWLARPQMEWSTARPEWMDDVFSGAYEKLIDIRERFGLPFPELALRWLLAEVRVDSICVGVGSVKELMECVAIIERGVLSEDLKKAIDDIGIVHPLIFQGRTEI